ncbi:MAG: prolyl oligopeptidase family serine peptidase [Alphaproteobacteria bacterium]|jgi:dipeptidyl aminopeptidase/acylaminoacyl peptidase|nr:prolyl oligopeptidase family serine peptidase [Alphaproteobacteria bacterium]MBU2040924.1 prolyl oligopeptidase family serine peptidase [Alphaproteobacteria bacterium]MBU2126235.1 prolyl oligopeptidase family serine peptidase [Alphaproteobacteria bacterium]MBU2207415.1 prolyl oligopeptidase family serine peptidase [Alphaproteobacteria bacterium]MBU2290189.1 prolyl oligopeptidase family serine peptidase [Alphaproteobacteria bacterium]
MRHRLLSRAMPAFVLLAVLAGPALAQDGRTYQQPPAPIADILDTRPTPTPSLSPDRSTLALFDRANLPPIAELAEPMLRLAGYRINPRNNGQANSRVAWLTGLSFQPVEGGAARTVSLPANARFVSPGWSPDGRSVALLMDAPTGLELWTVDVASGGARRLTDARVNAAAGGAYDWLPDSSGLLVRLTPEGRGPAPDVSRPPEGPIIEESLGRTAPARTYQDLLSNAGDEALFDHYFTSQLTLVPLDGPARTLGAPAVYLGSGVSPDGRYILQTTAKRPYSYVVPAGLFPAEVVITDLQGIVVHRVADLPLRDNIPTPFDSVAPGPRSAQWRADAPSTLVWAEAQDGGDPRTAAEVRDRVFMLAAPFTARPTPLIDLKDRYAGIIWGDADTALVVSRQFNSRRETRHLLDPSNPGQGRVLLERNYQDRYNDPGFPVTQPNASGFPVMRFNADGSRVLMTGAGATREGEYPFLAAMDLTTGETERLWTSEAGAYESVVGILDEDGRRLVTRRETRNDPPNLFVRDLDGQATALTSFPDPAPQLAGATKQLISYTRADGVQLSGTLYLPAGYDKDRDGPLPLVMWAYPAEFTDAAVAGQVVDTANRFTRPGGISHLFLLTQGYAVLDDPSMPIVGVDGAEPNDTYIQQLSASAEAAVNAVVELGVADRDRIAVGGHSYGAFMTANLLAHTDLFRTGIARSGAYNRTLTPFGFQAEQRTYWEATDTYTEMSPFTYANRVNEPILLIHGEADDNSGTFPVQSERFYAALKGNGANVRYVVLPFEAHGYRARESVGHTHWEMTRWLDQYLKNAPAR